MRIKINSVRNLGTSVTENVSQAFLLSDTFMHQITFVLLGYITLPALGVFYSLFVKLTWLTLATLSNQYV